MRPLAPLGRRHETWANPRYLKTGAQPLAAAGANIERALFATPKCAATTSSPAGLVPRSQLVTNVFQLRVDHRASKRPVSGFRRQTQRSIGRFCCGLTVIAVAALCGARANASPRGANAKRVKRSFMAHLQSRTGEASEGSAKSSAGPLCGRCCELFQGSSQPGGQELRWYSDSCPSMFRGKQKNASGGPKAGEL